jgi:hypothetical protein
MRERRRTRGTNLRTRVRVGPTALHSMEVEPTGSVGENGLTHFGDVAESEFATADAVLQLFGPRPTPEAAAMLETFRRLLGS